MSDKMTVADVMTFARKNWLDVVMRAGASFVIIIGLLVLYYAFAPREASYRIDVQITLESTGANHLHYPNGRRFSTEDLISTPVLHRVWTKFGLEKAVEFDDFCKWFSLVGFDKDRAKLDAEYQTKMGKRNITVTELTSLQKEYETKISALSPNAFTVSMKPDSSLNRTRAVEILGAVPQAWYDEYAILNAPQIPAVMRPEAIRVYWKDLQDQKGRSLELVDTLRRFLAELRETCAYVRTKVLVGRNAIIDGTDLGTHEAHLTIYSSEILRLKNLLLENGDPNDLDGYVKSRLDDMACDELETQQGIEAVRQTLDILNEKSYGAGFAAAQNGAKNGTSGAASPVAMQTDGSFFNDFAQMVRKDAKQESVRKYADSLTEERRKLAELAARKLYYDQIENYIKAASKRPTPRPLTSEAKAATDRMVKNILDDGEKILAFRDKALKIYRTSNQFYALPGPAQFGRTFTFSIARLALGLLALWALYNFVFLIFVWNKRTE